MSGYPQKLENMFLESEEASERRARELEEQERVAAPYEWAYRSGTPITMTHPKDRRRGSISISRFGQVLESQSQGPKSSGLTPIAAQSPFYQAQAANMSNASFASGASDLSDERAHEEDHSQVTQIHQIAGKQGLSKAVNNILPRRLSRTKSAILTPIAEANLVIGVSVHESTTEASDAESCQLGTTVTVSAPGSHLHNRSSRRTLSTASSAKWVAKAKSFTQNFRLKPKHVSLSNSQNVPS